MDTNTAPQDPIKARYWAEKKARQQKPDRFGMDTLARAMWTGLFRIFENGRLRPDDSRSAKTEKRHQDFVTAYNSNAMNFLPGHIVHGIYSRDRSQKAIEADAKATLVRPGNEHLLEAARARGYTG